MPQNWGEEDSIHGTSTACTGAGGSQASWCERLLGEGKDLGEVCRHLGISEQTWHRWRNQYGAMKAEDTKRLKELERENQRLKKLVAEQALDIDMLKEIVSD